MATLNIKGFPDKLYDEIREDAERHHRSLAGHVTFLLERGIRERQRPSLDQIRGLGWEVWAEIDASGKARRRHQGGDDGE